MNFSKHSAAGGSTPGTNPKNGNSGDDNTSKGIGKNHGTVENGGKTGQSDVRGTTVKSKGKGKAQESEHIDDMLARLDVEEKTRADVRDRMAEEKTCPRYYLHRPSGVNGLAPGGTHLREMTGTDEESIKNAKFKAGALSRSNPGVPIFFFEEDFDSGDGIGQRDGAHDSIHTNPYPRETVQPAPFSHAGPQNRFTPTGTVYTAKATYAVVGIIMAPSTDDTRMSDGIRLVQHQNGELRVEKRLLLTTRGRVVRADAEKEALEQIIGFLGRHPNINYLFEAFYPPNFGHGCLILEHCDMMTLDHFIKHSRHFRVGVTEGFCWHVLAELSAALAVCHLGMRDPLKPQYRIPAWNTICHLDIKPCNIFLSSVQPQGREDCQFMRVVLGDFGCAVTRKDILEGRQADDLQPAGTPGWYPPEAERTPGGLMTGKYGRPTDIWQMGGVVQVMASGGSLEVPDQVRVRLGRPCGPIYSADLQYVIRKIMTDEATRRPTAVDVARIVDREQKKRGF